MSQGVLANAGHQPRPKASGRMPWFGTFGDASQVPRCHHAGYLEREDDPAVLTDHLVEVGDDAAPRPARRSLAENRGFFSQSIAGSNWEVKLGAPVQHTSLKRECHLRRIVNCAACEYRPRSQSVTNRIRSFTGAVSLQGTLTSR